MPKHFLLVLISLLIAITGMAQRKDTLVVSQQSATNAFTLFSANNVATINIDQNDAKVVAIAAETFAQDVMLVSGKKMMVGSKPAPGAFNIIAGTIGQSKLVDDFIKEQKIDVTSINNKWECFSIHTLKSTGMGKSGPISPFRGSGGSLLIIGSNPRGTAYGILHLSKLMGVSPWVWWADVMPVKKDKLYIYGSYTSSEPSVKYRGIFLNDEDWGLQPWAAKTFEPGVGDIGPKTYGKIFQLLLRLNANLIWPAMHPSTKAFFSIPGNAKAAEDYGIIIGSSHAEPMLRNNVGEWDEKTMGHFNYISNKEKVTTYWEARVKESSSINAMYTLGMRGVHDGKMEGVSSSKEAVPVLETIFKDQREMLSKYVNKDIKKIPQVFTAYKEVLDIYDSGLSLPDDVTIIWPDDNYGYIQRLNNPKEKSRPGGSGVYYHASYWGRPHDYLWLSSTHPALIREEMMKAYNNGSDRVWVLNVGDIKPLEYNIELFMNMAYHAKPFQDPNFSQQHLQQWCKNIFGKKNASAIQQTLWDYYQLAFERRPEFMGWSQTEPTTKTSNTKYNHFQYGDEAMKRIDQYQALQQQVMELEKSLSPKDFPAFYELIYYPVVGASLMNKKFLYQDKAAIYNKQYRLSAGDYAARSTAAYDSIISETNRYNDLLDGKWKHMMSMAPRNLPVFAAPSFTVSSGKPAQGWNIIAEGSTVKDSANKSEVHHLPAFDNLHQQQYFIDIFICDTIPLNWIASGYSKWIRLSENSGMLTNDVDKKEKRLTVNIDWKNYPSHKSSIDTIWFSGNGNRVPVVVDAKYYEPGKGKGFVENSGMVVMHASYFSSKESRQGSSWELLPGLGYTGSSIQSASATTDTSSVLRDNAFVQYDFTVLSPGHAKATFFTLPTHPLNNVFKMRYGFSLDGGLLTIIDFKTVGRSEEWKQNVLRNRAEKTASLSYLAKGKHRLRVYAIDPGVILDEIRITLDEKTSAYSVLEETKIK